MEFDVVENKTNVLKLKFKVIDQGIMSAIKAQVWEDKATELAGFKVTHPETGTLDFTLKTKGKSAQKVWNDALSKLSKKTEEFKKSL